LRIDPTSNRSLEALVRNLIALHASCRAPTKGVRLKSIVKRLFFTARSYDLSGVGRNESSTPAVGRCLKILARHCWNNDVSSVACAKDLAGYPLWVMLWLDDIDHLGTVEFVLLAEMAREPIPVGPFSRVEACSEKAVLSLCGG